MTEPLLTREQSRQVDRLAIERYGMSSLVLMENAGRGCADRLCQLGIEGPVVICCGKGNNGGDGLVIARHLDLRGHQVRVLMWDTPAELSRDARANFDILQHAGIPVHICETAALNDFLARQTEGADWVVDALLGTGAHGNPRPPVDQVISSSNQLVARRLAVDLPSGLDCDTGIPAEPTFRADHTCTFFARKAGFQARQARPFLGQVHVLDIGTPGCLMRDLENEGGRP